jgi:hypothetical protein
VYLLLKIVLTKSGENRAPFFITICVASGSGEMEVRMKDTFILANFLTFLALLFLSLALLYYIIKVAVRNGVDQANAGLMESVRSIEKAVAELKKIRE